LFQKGNKACWTYKFLRCMVKIGLTEFRRVASLKRLSVEDICSLKFSEKAVAEAMMNFYKRWWGNLASNPRTAASEGVALGKHHQWFHDKELHHLSMTTSKRHTETLIRFRLGCTDLRINDHSIPRANRKCLLCMCGDVEDEMHVVLQCYRYDFLRRDPRWCDLFSIEDIDMNKFMNQKNQHVVASFITTLFHFRKLLLAERDLEVENLGRLDTFSSDSDDIALVDLLNL